MACTAAVRFLSSLRGSTRPGVVQLQLRVKTGASKDREGVLAVTDTAVELCVGEQPVKGQANKAVIQILSNATGIPKSRMRFARGLKSKDKIVTIGAIEGDGPAYAQTILGILRKASYRGPPP